MNIHSTAIIIDIIDADTSIEDTVSVALATPKPELIIGNEVPTIATYTALKIDTIAPSHIRIQAQVMPPGLFIVFLTIGNHKTKISFLFIKVGWDASLMWDVSHKDFINP